MLTCDISIFYGIVEIFVAYLVIVAFPRDLLVRLISSE